MNISINSTSFNAKIQFDNPKPKFQKKAHPTSNKTCFVQSKKCFSWKILKQFISDAGVFIEKIKTIKSGVKLPS